VKEPVATDSKAEIRDAEPTVNAWLARLGEDAPFDGRSLRVTGNAWTYSAVRAGDGFLVVDPSDPGSVAFGRLYRTREGTNGDMTFHFDGVARPVEGFDTESLGLPTQDGDPSPPVDWGRFTGTLEGLDQDAPGLGASDGDAPLTRMTWARFSEAFESATGTTFDKLPRFDSDADRPYVRDLFQEAVVDDLLGPAGGPDEEIVGMSVRDRYLVGKLAPGNVQVNDDDDLAGTSGENEPEDTNTGPTASTNHTLVSSSMGTTFCVDGDVASLVVEARWGSYRRLPDETKTTKKGTTITLQVWERIPSGGRFRLDMKEAVVPETPVDDERPEVVVRGTVRGASATGDRLVTLFLVNKQTSPDQNRDAAWVFQPELVVRDAEDRPVFRRRPSGATDDGDREREALEMIYRDHVEFAVGHGVSVHATPSEDDPVRAVEIRTVTVPEYEVPITETPGRADEDRAAMRRMTDEGLLDMTRLAEMSREELLAALEVLTDDYATWIGDLREGAADDTHQASAASAMDRCEEVLERLREGAEALRVDDAALEAFRFANHAMALQRVRSEYSRLRRRGEDPALDEVDVPRNRSWRPFQLAFVLLSIPALADPTHRDRTEPTEAYADLIWFPTGGGKTEAYLGVAAFTMAMRRLRSDLGGLDASRGLAVIMRYTLRLLTLQQFQRATTLMCAMETIRLADPEKWGDERFTIGLWVGMSLTPNHTKQAHEDVEDERKGRNYGSTPAQLTACPWCGEEIDAGRDVVVDVETLHTSIYCGDKYGRCEFSKTASHGAGIPAVVVDEEIYRRPPSMLVATVDKFAQMSWRGQVRTLFGKAESECPRHGLLWPGADCTGGHPKKGSHPATKAQNVTPLRPPDLVIQDEFHLISGPLGTMVGLYETAVDEMCAWELDGKQVRPKIVASTATARKAAEQMRQVFLRRVSIFPPHGLDVADDFFSVRRDVADRPGRRYLGICSPGSSRPATLIRLYVALLTAAKELYDTFGHLADPYMTLVGYFNSLRELGGMKRLAEDDVQTRSYKVGMSRVDRPGLAQRSVNIIEELTSRVSNREIPRTLDKLETAFKPEWEKGETRAIDVVLATNMLSVGVDVNRLGLLAVNGQPKNTAEYIQATSRVGRMHPGIVFTALSWSRPRDMSHYETFEHYHATFYKHVEAQSVTPFSPRALDRGLTGALVGMLRLENDHLTSNEGASRLHSPDVPEVDAAKTALADRAWKVTNEHDRHEHVKAMVSTRVDQWITEAEEPGRTLGYERQRKQGDLVALLKKPGPDAWDPMTVPTSMREVEPGVRLIMGDTKLEEGPAWKHPAPGQAEGDQ
jgi:hypothetical protein